MKINEIIVEAKATSQRLDPKCWKGYKKQGTKVKGGVRVNNCVPVEESASLEPISAMTNRDLALYLGTTEDVVAKNREAAEEAANEKSQDYARDQFSEDWQKVNKKDKTDGMSRKAVNAYRRENPGSKLKTAVTTKPSKLKKGSKASKRRKSYCSRSKGQMDMHNISCAKTPDKAICKARRRWNCEE